MKFCFSKMKMGIRSRTIQTCKSGNRKNENSSIKEIGGAYF